MKNIYTKLRLGLNLLAILLAAIAMFWKEFTWFFIAGAVVCFIVGYVITWKYCRCPKCNRVLPNQLRFPDTCPYCRESLRNEHY